MTDQSPEEPGPDSPPVDKPETVGARTATSLILFGALAVFLLFLKSGEWHVGEETICRDLGVSWYAIGDGFTWDADDLDESRAIAREAWALAERLLADDEYRLLVLDEISYAMTWEWIDTARVAAAIAARTPRLNVILTGRDMPDEIIELADTVTEMRNVKHAFDAGIVAKKGIDY